MCSPSAGPLYRRAHTLFSHPVAVTIERDNRYRSKLERLTRLSLGSPVRSASRPGGLSAQRQSHPARAIPVGGALLSVDVAGSADLDMAIVGGASTISHVVIPG